MVRLQPSASGRYVSCTPPSCGELERVRQQVLQDLLQALGVGHHAAAEVAIDVDVEGKLAVLGLVAERPRRRV